MLKATNLLQTTTPAVTLTCNTATGPSASQTITVKPVTALTGSNTLAVGLGALSGGVSVSPSTATFNAANSAAGVVFTVSLAAGCVNVTTAAPTFRFTQGGSNTVDLTITVNTTLTAVTSGLAAPATVTLTCIKNGSTYYPGGAQTVSITSAATGGTPFTVDTVTNAAAAWATINPTTGGTATGVATTFTVTPTAGCGAFSAGTSNNTTIHLLNAPAPDKTITVTLQVSAPSASSLVVNPSPITITCAKSGGNYYPSFPQTVGVTSPAVGGTAFTVDTVTAAPAAWLTVTPTTGGTATASPVNFTLQAAAGCGAFAANSTTTTTVHLLNPPANDKVFSVTLQIVPLTVLVATPSPATLTYVKGSGTAGYVDVNITAPSVNPAPFFTVNTATLPIWARLDSINGVAPKSLRFSSTTVADTLAPGTYSANILVSVSGYGDLTVPLSMLLTNKAPQLSIQGPTTVAMNWTIGQSLPTPTITALSTDTPIAYTATSGGTLAPVIPVAQQSGLAYSFGSPINVSFNPQVFAAAQPGNVLTGTVTLTWGSPASTIVVTFNITVVSPGATVTALSPASVPTGSAGTIYTVALTGTGFVPSTDSTQKTRVGIVATPGSPMVFDTALQANVINQSNITVTITVPNGADANIPFAGGTFNIGVCNPVAGTCTVATGYATLTIGTNPIIQAVTSSSALLQTQTVSVAPYDMISIFGANFCPSCTTNQLLTGAPDATTLTYPTALPFDGSHSLTVTFQTHSNATPLGSAPMLFATNGQINLMVPSTVLAQVGNQVDIIVNYGSGSFGSQTLKSSTPFTVTIVATNPGIFTIGADGQGSGAALDMNYSLISPVNPAGIRTGANNSDVISIYMTGLGAPDDANLASNASATSGAGYAWSADCVTTSSYRTSFNAAQTGTPIATLDGTLIIPGVLNTGRLVPCISSAGTDVPTVTIGGVAATVKYAGWVPGTIAGLYQINVQLPVNTASAFTNAAGLTGQSIGAPVQLPVVVTANSVTSQSGVTLWVAPRLKVVGPTSGGSAGTVSAAVGTSLPSLNNSVTATQGTGSMHYAVTSGLLPAGLSINAGTGLISGTPAAGTAGSYTVTVTATDSANVPVTGSVTFVVTVAGGLFMSNTVPSASTFGTANGAVTTVTASSGVYPYTYSMAITSHTLPTGMSINVATGLISTTVATPAGSYLVVVSATDSTSGTPLTGSSTFTIVVGLEVGPAVVTPSTNSGWTTSVPYNTMPTLGGSGTYVYSLDVASQAFVNANSAWLSFSTSTGVLTIAAQPPVTGSFNVTVTATDSTTPANAAAAGTGTAAPFAFLIGS